MLLFGAETWVVTTKVGAGAERVPPWGGEADHWEAGAEREGRDWYYPSLEGAMREAGLTDIWMSIINRQNTVAHYIATRLLLDLCKGARAREGAKVPLRWWNQAGIEW